MGPVIPIATTTISVLRAPTTDATDPYDEPAPEAVIASGVRAHISLPGAVNEEAIIGGQEESIRFRLACDPTDLKHTDRVRDERTGEEYEVEWAQSRIGLDLDHVSAGLKQVDGLAR